METIAVDLMGGDKAPDAVMRGVLEAVAEQEVTIALVGTAEALAGCENASQAGKNRGRIIPFEASQVVTMAESPADAWRNKKHSSITIGIQLVKEGRAGAFVSAGNSGAVAAASLLILETMAGIDRPAIATLYRTKTGSVAMLLDVGANVDCRPAFLLQFGQMGSQYIALLSNGEEDSKGTRLVKEAHKLLKESQLNFIGNVEGFDLVDGVADVFVTDCFTGNVVLKLAEALTTSIFMSLRDALGKSPLARASKILWGPPVRAVARQWFQTDIRGAPLLGVRGNIVMAHGRSEATEIKEGITLARRMVREGWSSAQPDLGSINKSLRTVSD
ncbi:MAG: fatty acid/phospholipid synthesis protein PlsX [Dehalococcoidia bacterium]|nr:fatty acid/phospholipid synthesis protein PlsX [Dehalococcoidia bacterium]